MKNQKKTLLRNFTVTSVLICHFSFGFCSEFTQTQCRTSLGQTENLSTILILKQIEKLEVKTVHFIQTLPAKIQVEKNETFIVDQIFIKVLIKFPVILKAFSNNFHTVENINKKNGSNISISKFIAFSQVILVLREEKVTPCCSYRHLAEVGGDNFNHHYFLFLNIKNEDKKIQFEFDSKSNFKDFYDSVKNIKYKMILLLYPSSDCPWEIKVEIQHDFGQIGQLAALKGKHLKVAAPLLAPYVIYRQIQIRNQNHYRNEDKLTGTNYIMWKEAALALNFTYDLTLLPGQFTGLRLRNGSWTGMTGAVFSRQYDLALLMGHTFQRHGVIDFSSNFGQGHMVFITGHPGVPQVVKWTAVLNPYKLTMWIAIAISFLVTTIIFYLIIQNTGNHGNGNGNGKGKNLNGPKLTKMAENNDTEILINSSMITFSLLMEQPVNVPKVVKKLTIPWMIFVVIIGVGYKSNLVSFLSAPLVPIVPTTFEQLALTPLGKYSMNYMYLKGAGFALFNSTKSPTLVRIRDGFKLNSNPISCVIDAALKSKTVCIGWNLVIDALTAKNLTIKSSFEPVRMSRIQNPAFSSSVTFGLQKNSRFTESVSWITSSVRDGGLYQKWLADVRQSMKESGRVWLKAEYKSRKNYTANPENESQSIYEKLEALMQTIEDSKLKRPFKISNLRVVFNILKGGIILSTLLFFGELYRSF